ncbi:MAG: hypothetical protein HC878_02545 [Leptolyngbyaceae cyanobacterium SL_5_14]|nr:hypothetical protein [Leptolyngbyaceae cyanobacterium SL_5_14]
MSKVYFTASAIKLLRLKLFSRQAQNTVSTNNLKRSNVPLQRRQVALNIGR